MKWEYERFLCALVCLVCLLFRFCSFVFDCLFVSFLCSFYLFNFFFFVEEKDVLSCFSRCLACCSVGRLVCV